MGRQPVTGDLTGLYFRGAEARFVSSTHAAIRWKPLGYEIEGEDPGMWELAHVGRTNPTWKGDVRKSSQLKYGQWMSIGDGDRFYFGDPRNVIVFGLYGHETMEMEDDDMPTADLSQPEMAAERDDSPSVSNPWEAALQLAISGPDSLSSWIWRLLLLLVGAIVAIAVFTH